MANNFIEFNLWGKKCKISVPEGQNIEDMFQTMQKEHGISKKDFQDAVGKICKENIYEDKPDCLN